MKFNRKIIRASLDYRDTLKRYCRINLTKEQSIEFFYYIKVAKMYGMLTNGKIGSDLIKNFVKGKKIEVKGDSAFEKRYKKLSGQD